MSVTDFLTIWWSHFEWLVRQLDWLVLFGALLIVGAVYLFARMSRNNSSAFDFAEMFEGDNGRTSMAKFLAFIGGLTSTWVVAALAATGTLSDAIFIGYLGVLVAGKVATEIWGRKGDDAGAAPAPAAALPDPPGIAALSQRPLAKRDPRRGAT